MGFPQLSISREGALRKVGWEMALAENWGVGLFEGVEGSICRNKPNYWSVFKNMQSYFPLGFRVSNLCLRRTSNLLIGKWGLLYGHLTLYIFGLSPPRMLTMHIIPSRGLVSDCTMSG